MKFRHIPGVRLALTSGLATFVGPDWRALRVDFHREALAAGCECDQTTIRTQNVEPPKASPDAVVPLDENAAIRKGLLDLVERNADGDFTKDGTPNLKSLEKLIGFKPEKQTALSVWSALLTEAQAAESQAAGEGKGKVGDGEQTSTNPVE